MLKALFNLPLRQATGLVASLLELADLDWAVPDYTTLCRCQKTLPVALGARPSSGGLHLLVDSTGVKMMGEGEWKTRKHGASYRRQWRKVHIGIDAGTLDIRALEVTTGVSGIPCTGRRLNIRRPWPERNDHRRERRTELLP